MSVYYKTGRYLGRITNQELSKTSTNKPQFVLSFTVLGLEGGDPDPAGYERRVYRVITDNTIPYILEDLAELGFSGESWASLDLRNSGSQSFLGQTHLFECTHEEWSGVVREKWSLHKELTRTESEPLPPQDTRKLDAMFGKALKELPRKEPPTQPITREEARAVGDQAGPSDIPF